MRVPPAETADIDRRAEELRGNLYFQKFRVTARSKVTARVAIMSFINQARARTTTEQRRRCRDIKVA